MTANLNVYLDGQERNLMEWIREKGANIYKDIGKKTWRVPPVKFNTQKLSEQKFNKKENDQQVIRIEGPVLGQPNVTDKETNRAENIVCGAFEKLSQNIVEKERGSAMFLISNFEYDNYLNKVSHFVTETQSDQVVANQTNNTTNVEPTNNSDPTLTNRPVVKLPKDVARRGELDILVLHQDAGVLLVQTKAVGYNFSDNSEFEWSNSVETAIEKAGEQLIRDRNVIMYIMEDLGLRSDQITSVVALPNLPRHVLQEEISSELRDKVYKEFHLNLDTNFLCEEDLRPDNTGLYTVLGKWWNTSLLPVTKGINIQTMQEIAFRTVGLLSTVGVWSYAQPRIEVRNLNEAAWETGNRYTQVVLSLQQVELLKHEDQYLYLCGPAGSGKTLLLSLKGRQWLRRDWNVAILNTRLGSRGRTVGQVIETTINKTEGLQKTVVRIDLDLMDNETKLSDIVSAKVGDKTFHFLLDEIAWVEETEKLLSMLKKSYPNSSIWCAGMLIECQPDGFQRGGLEVILRCPPSVQRVLRIVDNRDERCQLYKLDSAKAGLPTDGLPAFFIIHSKHGDPSIQPYDCCICARELSDILINNLNMKCEITTKNDITKNDITKIDITEKITPQDVSQSVCSKTTIGHSDYVEIDSNKLGSSRNSDSGCDLEFKENTLNDTFDQEIATSHDKKNTDTVVKQKEKNGNMKPPKKNKKKGGNVFENNPDEKRNVGIHNFDTTVDTPSLRVNIRNPKTSNNDKSSKDDSENIPRKSKPRKNPNSGKNQNCMPVNNCEDSTKSGKENSEIGLATIIHENTKSDSDKINKNQNPINAAGSHSSKKKCRKGKSKHSNNTTGKDSLTDSTAYPLLNFRDAVLPVTVPRGWHHYNKRGYWSISREALAQEMVLLGSRSFCKELYNSKVPLKVEEAMVMNAEGKELENYFVMCPVGAVHGLEYKLVVCVPSACALPEYIEISQGIRHGSMEPKEMMKRTQFGTDFLNKIDHLGQEQYQPVEACGTNGPEIDKVRISTHVAEQDAPYDLLYQPLSEGDSHVIPDDNQIYSQTAVSSKPYVAPSYTESEIMKIKNELCGHCGDKDKCVCQYFNCDELAAIHRLDAWNKAYVLMCASRCTSTLVLVLP